MMMIGSPVSQRSMENALENMNSLIANLEANKQNQMSENEVNRLHDSVDTLLWKVSESKIGCYEELEELLYSFKSGIMTPYQLENFIVAEQQKSEFILSLSAMIGHHLAGLCEQFQEMAARYGADGNGSVMSEQYDDIGTQLRIMCNEVSSLGKIINSPSSDLHSTIGSVEISLAGYQETMLRLNKRSHARNIQDDASVGSDNTPGTTERSRRKNKKNANDEAEVSPGNDNILQLIPPFTPKGGREVLDAPGSLPRRVTTAAGPMTPVKVMVDVEVQTVPASETGGEPAPTE
jgi:hypothetical protein